jgi:hypothetical protein
MMTEFETGVMADILEWAYKFYAGEQDSFSHIEMIEDYWQSYFSNTEMRQPESGLAII